MGMFSCHFPFPSLDLSNCCFSLSYGVSKHKPKVSIPEHRLNKPEQLFLVSAGTPFGSLEARLHFPHLVSRGGSYFGSDKDPSRTVFGSAFAYIHVILVRRLSLIFP
jgi:hypothetical protein